MGNVPLGTTFICSFGIVYGWCDDKVKTVLKKGCCLLSSFDHNRLTGECGKVGAMIGSMLNKPE